MSHLKDVLLEHLGQHVFEEAEAVKRGGAHVDTIVEHRLIREELLEILRETKRRNDNDPKKD